MKSVKIMIFLSILFSVAPAAAQDISGPWFLNANGWTFELEIEQRGREIIGRMIPTNSSDPTSKIFGRIEGRKIIFIRTISKQEFEGYLFDRDPGIMAGRFNHRGSWEFGWFARRL